MEVVCANLMGCTCNFIKLCCVTICLVRVFAADGVERREFLPRPLSIFPAPVRRCLWSFEGIVYHLGGAEGGLLKSFLIRFSTRKSVVHRLWLCLLNMRRLVRPVGVCNKCLSRFSVVSFAFLSACFVWGCCGEGADKGTGAASDSSSPELVVSKCSVVSSPPGQDDKISGAAGALVHATAVAVYADESLKDLIGEGKVDGVGGGFSPVSLGDNRYAAVYVVAVSADGRRSAPQRFDNDIVAPEVEVLQTPPALIVGEEATLTFGCNEADCTYRCQLDVRGYELCASPWTLTNLEGGSHKAVIEAIDKAGNTLAEMYVFEFEVESGLPEVTLSKTPEAISGQRVSFEFTCPTPPCAFECALDKEAYSPCTSPRDIDGLTPGFHAFKVRSMLGDTLNGNPPKRFDWEVRQ